MADSTTVLWWTAAFNVIAIVAAPITALWVQRKGDDNRALKKRREEIFRVLWTNRARPMYVARVDALNMIDVEFFGQKKILDAWADLLAHYRTNYKSQGVSDSEQARLQADKYSTLLVEIGQLLGYEFAKTHIRDDIYRPEIHSEIDALEIETRRMWLEVLKQDALPIRVVPSVSDPSSPRLSGG